MKKKIISFDALSFRKNPYPGKLIVVEGIDGAGKTTQAKELVKRLNKTGYNASYSKEPTEDLIGTLIREKVLSGEYKLNPLALQYLFNADRAMHMEKIERLLGKGMTIIMDRYFWSSVAYAMNDMDKPMDWYYTAFSILSFYHQFILPNATFFLRIHIQTALKRIGNSQKHSEIYDNGKAIRCIKENYEKLIKEFPKKFSIVDGEKTSEEVTDTLYTQITQIISQK